MGARVDNVVTSGTFELDGGSWEVDNNVWLIGDDTEVLIVDAAHDARAIADAVGDRTVAGIVCTHGHNDHINAVADLKQLTGAPVWLNADDRMLWDELYPDAAPDKELVDGTEFSVAGSRLHVLQTPGHSPGSSCLYAEDLGMVFTGDTLFSGGPGATGRSYSSRPTIVDSIRKRLLVLPDRTVVHTGHGEDTTIGAELGESDAWSEDDD